MTDPTPHRRDAREESFDSVLHPDPLIEEPTHATRAPRRWLIPAATVTLALLGLGAIGAALLVPASAATTTAESTPTPTPTRTPIAVTSNATASSGVVLGADASVSELADPDWVARIAAEGHIPERALAAYAGASLAVAATHPDCGLGWNTLAAIGLVESEHGTINGSTIGADGVAKPSIIGIPLDGNGTNPVPDTDKGVLDGDTTWDRAVGPLQIIPDTWNRYAQDGNGDGITDPHNIDDAALAAATYLCTAGGILTEPANWIAAIDAYNPSVDYNNRVAEAATSYATLR